MVRLALPLLLLLALTLLSPAGPVSGQEKEPGRAGVVTEVQGGAFFRPAGRARWTPLEPGAVLLPGDRVRTLLRGAHVAEMTLACGSRLTLGPGGLLTVLDGDGVRLTGGDLAVASTAPVRVLPSPGGTEGKVVDAVLTAEVKDGELRTTALDSPPQWLERYRETSTEEWMGSLVAKVDGRNTPLTIGTHQVTVTIRDQIAETVVEETFENHTGIQLEGEFSFPLPADASVSGFGMWIGGELVMADIVERQRARQIYEDIRRRKKDPGLLEWSGGNVFKARVFPIPAHGAKRIRIRYTQVLPLTGNTYRYRYALRSELLRKHPLERLGIRVSVDSTAFLEQVVCPTHPVESTGRKHTATLEYDAQDVTPSRDFEVEIRLADPEPLTVVPHRRGDDGYFMLLLSPPGPEAAGLQRELTAEGTPLDLLLLADTSGSMGDDDRKAQARFLAALLAHLGPEDTFRLAACDRGVTWLAPEPLPATEENVRNALAALDDRVSLGWTDLAGAFKAALPAVREGTHILYVGDGIGTTGDADPGALATRLRELGAAAGATCHAVSPGTAYEKLVLEAVASLGGGTVREAAGDPATAARALIAEISQPAVKNLEVEFEGLRTAKVYPERLPNLAAGTQQVILGRFLPTTGTQRGKVVVRGTRKGEPVVFSAPLVLVEGEEGNSFLPRLWARRHLDHLLSVVPSAEVREEIVAFSREYDIITPYTSFLVLESDEDRRRYGVERRVKMRDAEEYFAEAKDRARTEALREQMQRARTWRLSLRERVLAEIADLGRSHPHGGFGYRPLFGMERARGFGAVLHEGESEEGDAIRMTFQPPLAGAEAGPFFGAAGEVPPRFVAPNLILQPEELSEQHAAFEDGVALDNLSRVRDGLDFLRMGYEETEARTGGFGFGYAEEGAGFDSYDFLYLFPHLQSAEDAEEEAEEETEEAKADEKRSGWPEDALELARLVARRRLAVEVEGGLATTVHDEYLHPLRQVTTHRYRAKGLLTRHAWHQSLEARSYEPEETWCSDGVRGALNIALRLGRRRPATESDQLQGRNIPGLTRWEGPLNYVLWNARREDRDDGISLLRVSPEKGEEEIVFHIDRRRAAVTKQVSFRGGKLQATVLYEDFVPAGGFWWPTRLRRLDSQGRLTSRAEMEIHALTAEEAERRIADALGSHGDVIFVSEKLPGLRDAKQAAHEGRAGFPERFRLALHHARAGRWVRMWTQFEAAEKLGAGKPGVAWLRSLVLSTSRRGEEAKAYFGSLVPSVLGAEPRARPWLAGFLLDQANRVLSPEELLELAGPLAPAFEEGWDGAWRTVQWMRRKARLHQKADHHPEARALWERILSARPSDPGMAEQCIGQLARFGGVEAALAAGRKAIAMEHLWLDNEASQVYGRLTRVLWDARRFTAFFDIVNRWLERTPDSPDPYARYLAGLREARPEEADHWVAERLSEGLDQDDGPVQRARLSAAISSALGHTWNLWSNRFDVHWEAPLADLARRLIAHGGEGLSFAGRIVTNDRFEAMDAGLDLAAELLRSLAPGRVEDLPLPTFRQIADWIDWHRENVGDAAWRSVVDYARGRWAACEDTRERNALEATILGLCDERGEPEPAIELLREALGRANPDYVPGLAERLLDLLLDRPYDAGREREIFGLIPRLVTSRTAEEYRRELYPDSLRKALAGLYRARVEASVGPQEERDELSRSELRLRYRKARESARRGLAGLLAEISPQVEPELRRWIDLERLCFEVELRGDVEARALELLDAVGPEPEDGPTRLLETRCALVLSRAAIDPSAPEGLPGRVLARFRERADAGAEAYRHRLIGLLLATDRVPEVEEALKRWTVPSLVESRWRVIRGRLLAERGKVREAVEVFETVAGLGELGAGGYGTLAGWYLVLGEDERSEQARKERWGTLSLDSLEERLWRMMDRLWDAEEGEAPVALDPETVEVARALLSRACDQYPRDRYHDGPDLSALESLYEATKDHRILEPLADAVLGRSPQAIYEMLWEVKDTLLDNVHEEATLDAVSRRIRDVRPRARGPADRRALWLLATLAERRAADVLNESGPHAASALEALRNAWKGEWLPGEPRRVAEFLSYLDAVPDEAFRAEQLRQLRELGALPVRRPMDRLKIAAALSDTLWLYEEKEEAVEGLLRALEACRLASGGRLPGEAKFAVGSLAYRLACRGKHAAAESFLLAERDRQVDRLRKDLYTTQLMEVYTWAVEAGAKVSIGEGPELYRKARALVLEAMLTVDPENTKKLFELYLRLHKAADRKALSPGEDLVGFSRGEFTAVLERFPQRDHHRLLSELATALAEIESPLAALTFYVERLEAEPAWRVRGHLGAWGRTSGHMWGYFKSVKDLGDLEPRLLAVVVRELKADLRSLDQESRTFYSRHPRLWKAKAGDFAKAAREVIEEHRDSPARLLYAAEYLWDGLDLKDEAVGVLSDALARGRIRTDGRFVLADWRMKRKEWASAVELLGPLVRENPDRHDFRRSHILSLHGAEQDDDGHRAADEASGRLSGTEEQGDDQVRRLGDVCLSCGYFERSAKLFAEALSRHRKRPPLEPGETDKIVPLCYRGLARSLSGLGRHEEAVDAATAAVVAWGESRSERRAALDTLQSVLSAVKDLDAWTAGWVAEADRTGLDSPLVRRILGRIHLKRKHPKEALPHLLAARRLQPDDPEAHELVVNCCKRLKDGAATRRAIVKLIHCAPAKLHLYDRLAKSFAKAGSKDEAERAWTSLAEFDPHEAAGHRKLAKIREKQRRLPEAVEQWRQVVRTRTFDPAGWLALARAQLRAGQKDAARRTVQEILSRSFDEEEFGDVHEEARAIVE